MSSSSNNEDVFSIRLVVADFYMVKPIPGLDPCYSEFRGKEIKKVPIVRIFGSTGDGQKTCMHVHGVFPYFYIPYERKDFESLNKAIYQIAFNVDKAINISLGQGSSTTQHVFKVQLVKGIPFYGYHRGEHQFLKIHMFNPRFVRRAANLLQNGAIMNKNFHPYESHVPYILQFMIDYNLYGMSPLHVPLEIVKFRRNDDNETVPFTNVRVAQILNTDIAKKLSSSALEVDISANFILNRFQLVHASSTHANPGIEAIWHDERIRRENLLSSLANNEEKLKQVPALEVPPTQERPGVQPTESDMFHRGALLSKLLTMQLSTTEGSGSQSEQTLLNNSMQMSLTEAILNATNTSSNKEQKRKFNLRKVMGNLVYPEECTQEDTLMNASCIENHLSSHSSLINPTLLEEQKHENIPADESESVFLDDTVVDEELVLSLTQPTVPLDASLRVEDMKLLEVLQQLEENNANEPQIDLDSTLAPLGQQHTESDLSPQLLDKQTAAVATNTFLPDDRDSESENEESKNDQDFSLILDDVDELILKLTPSQPTPDASPEPKLTQIDGADDQLKTPKKQQRKKPTTKSPGTPKSNKTNSPVRSPRTPKSSAAKKYAPLPLIITNRGGKKNLANDLEEESASSTSSRVTRLSLQATEVKSTSGVSLRKKLALTEMRRKSLSNMNDLRQEENKPTKVLHSPNSSPKRGGSRKVNLDKTHITCALTPRRRSERLLKVYRVENQDNEATGKKEEVKTTEKLSPSGASDRIEKSVSSHGKDTQSSDGVIEISDSEESLSSAVKAVREKDGRKIKSENLNQDGKCSSEERSISSRRTSHYNASGEIEIMESEEDGLTPPTQTTGKRKLLMGISEETESEEIAASDNEEEHSLVKLRKTPNYKKLRHEMRILQKAASQTPQTPKAKNSDNELSENEDDDEKIHSFYETSFFNVDSPSALSENSSPSLKTTNLKQNPLVEIISSDTTSSPNVPAESSTVVVTPLDLPPSYDEVLALCPKLDINEYDFQKPHYSNPADITKVKEVGFTVLQIPGNKLNDCPEFESVLSKELKSLNEWRREKLFAIGGAEALSRYRSVESVREYFASLKRVVITPLESAPERYAAMRWLKARELLKEKEEKGTKKEFLADEDSPIKVRRQRVAMILNDEAAGGDEGAGTGEEDADCSSRSLTLTPMSPEMGLKVSESEADCTPLSTYDRASSKERTARRKKRARLSLNARLKAALGAERNSTDSILTEEGTTSPSMPNTGYSSNAHKPSELSSQSGSTTISSQSVLAELERSSFVKNLQSGRASTDELSTTLDNTFGFKVNLENLQQAKADIECNYLTTMALEVFVVTRENLLPNPELDEIRCIFYALNNSIPPASNPSSEIPQLPQNCCGYIIVDDHSAVPREGKVHGIDADIQVRVVSTEIEVFEALLELCAHWDPDIYAGYEIEMASWGYVMERAKYLCFNIGPLLSRVPSEKVREAVEEEREQFTELDFEMKLCGRILLDVWRLMRSEIALTSYSFENVMYHILHKRGPWHSHRDLTKWYLTPGTRWIVIEYYLERVRGTLALLEQLDLIGRTSEMAKLIGIQFYEVLSRGSQFRVESMMLRMAKPRNLVPLSPSVQQRAHMRAPEYLPLILEPQSRFYADPVIVLDFQSLYPSMIIGYNYCFSTCLGRVEHLGHSSPFEFGASQLRVSPSLLRDLYDRDLITIAPGGVVFVKSSVREGILPRMLTEILDTRQMVKQSMKLHKTNSALQRILHSRQLGLKLMANVTYGYTAANFSGRMPAVEVGDSVVAKGRETLERAIKLVEANEKWRVKVVYGDTDSLFVLVPGRNRAQAFKIGEEIAEAVTKANPQPVKLKLEKVYQPCILQTKKRYVGYMYETADQAEPVYEAKGIETVRRDGCPAVQKMLEKVLRILFETADVSQVKRYVCRQFTKLLSGKANLQDLIFAKEFRGLNGYKPKACVPALELTRKWLQTDPRHIPRCGERVPFVIINGPPGVPLIRLVRSPHEVLADEGLKINAIYYITKAIIPPLNRCLLLIGADVNEWFASLPRKLLLTPALATANELMPLAADNQQHKKSTISQYFSTTQCVVDCGRQTKQGICAECQRDAMKSFVIVQTKIAKIERAFQLTQNICQACCGRGGGDLNCASLDCPVLYVREVKRREVKQIDHFRRLLEECF